MELSDRLNDKLDEVFDLQSDLESAKAATLHWQQLALKGNGALQRPDARSTSLPWLARTHGRTSTRIAVAPGAENAAAAAGSAHDAITKKRKENVLRAAVVRIYEQVVSRFNTPSLPSTAPSGTSAGAGASAGAGSAPAGAAAGASAKGGAPAEPTTKPKAAPASDQAQDDDDDDDGEYSDDYDDYDDDEFDDVVESPKKAVRTSSAKVIPLQMTDGGSGRLGNGSARGFKFNDPALTTPRRPLTADEVQDLPLDELCQRLETCIADVDARRLALVRRVRAVRATHYHSRCWVSVACERQVTELHAELTRLTARVKSLEASASA